MNFFYLWLFGIPAVLFGVPLVYKLLEAGGDWRESMALQSIYWRFLWTPLCFLWPPFGWILFETIENRTRLFKGLAKLQHQGFRFADRDQWRKYDLEHRRTRTVKTFYSPNGGESSLPRERRPALYLECKQCAYRVRLVHHLNPHLFAGKVPEAQRVWGTQEETEALMKYVRMHSGWVDATEDEILRESESGLECPWCHSSDLHYEIVDYPHSHYPGSLGLDFGN